MQKIKLAEFFSCLKPKYLLGTTYTLSLTFFESVVWPTIPKSNLDNCLILCDKLGYHRALSEAGTLRDIGARYFVVPINAKGAFHPKVWLAANDENVALLVGSGNLTQSGFIDNVELFWATQFDLNQGAGAICEDIRRFLDGLAGLVDKNLPSSGLAQSLIRAIYNLLPEWNGDDTPPRLLTSFHDPLPLEIKPYGTGGNLFVSSPYFGGDLAGYKLLTQAITPAKTTLCPGMMQDGLIDLDLPKNLPSLSGVDLMKVKFCKSPRRGEHFKLYGHQGNSTDDSWLYCGSANCTYPALTGKNVEAGVLLAVSSEDISSFFECERLEGIPSYQKEENTDGERVNHILFAAYSDDGLKLSLPLDSPLSAPFIDIVVEYRVGVRRAKATIERMFSNGTVESISKEQFDREFPSSIFASPYLFVSGTDSAGKPVAITCVIDDINTLKASAREKGATRAASAASRGESPELADIVEYFKYIEGALDDGFELGRGKGTGGATIEESQTVADRIAIWPPEPVVPPSESSGGHDPAGKYYYFWLDRMLRVFNTKKPNAPSVISEGTLDDEQTAPQRPVDKSSKPPAEWVEAQKRAESNEQKFKELALDSRQANCVYPTAILTHLMLLSIRNSHSGDVSDGDRVMDSPANIAALMIRSLFADRTNLHDEHGYSIAEQCHHKHSVPIFKQFAEDIISAFAELSLAKTDNFPINSWLKFKSLCDGHFENFISASDEIWQRYMRHFPWHERGVSESEFMLTLENLSQKGWSDHPGYLATQEIIGSVREKRDLDWGKLHKQAQAQSSKFTRRLKRGRPVYLRASRFQRYCIATDCDKQFIIQAELRRLEQIEPVLCECCGTALIPDILYDAMEVNHG